MLHGTGKLRLLISWLKEIILDYLGEPNVITRVLVSSRGRQGGRVRVIQCE